MTTENERKPDLIERMAKSLTVAAGGIWEPAEEADRDEIRMLVRTAILPIVAAAINEAAHQWQAIATAPRDGTYMFLLFPGPFHDQESPGVAVGKAIDREPGWWLTSIWAASTAHHQPTHWMPLPSPPAIEAHKESGQ